MPIWAATSDVLISSFSNLLNEESGGLIFFREPLGVE